MESARRRLRAAPITRRGRRAQRRGDGRLRQHEARRGARRGVLAHLPSTYDLARRGGKILADRQDALDAANAKKALMSDWWRARTRRCRGLRLVRRGKARESGGDVDRLVDAPAGPAWTKSLIAARVASRRRQVWLARAVQDSEGGLDAAAFRAKPVVDAVAYVVKGLAAGNDRDWVVRGDECSTLEMWGAELAALLGFPLGRGFEVRRITDSPWSKTATPSRASRTLLIGAAGPWRCRAAPRGRLDESIVGHRAAPSHKDRQERSKSGKMKDPKVVVAGNKLVKLEALFEGLRHVFGRARRLPHGALSGEDLDTSPSVWPTPPSRTSRRDCEQPRKP